MKVAVNMFGYAEMLLDRGARQYAQGMKERGQLMEQWSSSVQHLTQRDKSIYAVLQDINDLREVAKDRMDEHREAEQFVLMQESENKELEESIRRTEREAVAVREEREKLANAVESYSVQLHYRRKELQQLGRLIEDTRAKLKRKNNELANKRLKLQDCRSKMDEMRQTLKRIDGQKLNTEERLVQMRQMLETEEGRKSEMVKETRRQQVMILKAAERQAELEGELKVQRMQARAESRRGEQLAGERAGLEKSLKETRERAYQADVTLQRTELRLDHLLGIERDTQALEAKHAKSSQLQKQLDQRTDVLKTLQSQISVVENQIRKISAAIASSNDEIQQMQLKQHGLVKLIECGEKQLRAGQAAYEERKVDENILQLRLRETDKIVSKVDDKLYDLEKYALQMDAAMQERTVDIKMQKESVNLQKRVMQGECAELRNMIAERRNRVQTLQARYDIHVACLGTNPQDGTPMTSAYLVIQSAQERYLLQERGDQLDRAIRKAEHEIRSMENTLKLVNMCNDKYKSSLSLVDENGPEKAEQKRLDQELFNALELVSQKRQALERAQQDCQRMEENCEQLDKDIDRVKEEKERKKQIVASLEQQITEQGEKLSRVDKNLRKILKDIQKKCICVSTDTILLQERDIAVRELQELNSLALQRITEFTIRHVEAEAYVKKLLAERNISIPSSFFLCKQPTPLSTSRRTDTTRSSTRASSSDLSATSLVPIQPDFSDTGSVKCPKPAFGVTQRRAFRRK